MPGPAVHYIVGKKLSKNYPYRIDYVNNSEGNNLLFDQSVINQIKEFQTYLNFGTVGPDFLFFNTKDWPGGEFIPVRAMIRFAEYLKSLEAKVEESFPILNQINTLKDQLEEVADEVVDNSPILSSIRLLLNDINAIIELMGGIVKSGIEDLVTSNIDIYGFLTSPIQNCDDKNNWWWFDVLHYRRTGQFAQYLLDKSVDDPALHAYSVGYLSHVAADAVGHPYVNNIVRGPYRTHGQRHNVVEKFQDVSAFNIYESDEFGTSELHKKFKFTESVHDLYSGQRIEEVESIIDGLTPGLTDVGLPKELTKLFSDATKNVFKSDGNHLFGGGMSEEEVDASYRLWYSWFESTTSEAILPESLPDLPPLSEEIREVWRKFVEKFNDAIDELNDAISDLFSGGGSSFSWDNIVNFFKKLARVIKAVVAAAAALTQAIEETIISIPKHALHFMLNQLYQALYSIYDYFRLSVSLNGLAFPAVRHLQDSRVQHMMNPAISDARNNRLANNWIYPIKKMDVSDSIFRTAPQEAHLVYPSPLNPENEKSTVAPFSYTLNPHDYYIDKDINLDVSQISGISPINDFDRHHRLYKNEQLGNACELTGALYQLYKEGKKIPDINLDGDRGIAYPCWEPENCVNGNIEDPVNPNFTD